MDVGPPAVLLGAPLGDGQPLAPLTGRLVIWTPDQVTRVELLAWMLGGLALALIVALSLWLLVERRRRRRAEQTLAERPFVVIRAGDEGLRAHPSEGYRARPHATRAKAMPPAELGSRRVALLVVSLGLLAAPSGLAGPPAAAPQPAATLDTVLDEVKARVQALRRGAAAGAVTRGELAAVRARLEELNITLAGGSAEGRAAEDGPAADRSAEARPPDGRPRSSGLPPENGRLLTPSVP